MDNRAELSLTIEQYCVLCRRRVPSYRASGGIDSSKRGASTPWERDLIGFFNTRASALGAAQIQAFRMDPTMEFGPIAHRQRRSFRRKGKGSEASNTPALSVLFVYASYWGMSKYDAYRHLHCVHAACWKAVRSRLAPDLSIQELYLLGEQTSTNCLPPTDLEAFYEHHGGFSGSPSWKTTLTTGAAGREGKGGNKGNNNLRSLLIKIDTLLPPELQAEVMSYLDIPKSSRTRGGGDVYAASGRLVSSLLRALGVVSAYLSRTPRGREAVALSSSSSDGGSAPRATAPRVVVEDLFRTDIPVPHGSRLVGRKIHVFGRSYLRHVYFKKGTLPPSADGTHLQTDNTSEVSIPILSRRIVGVKTWTGPIGLQAMALVYAGSGCNEDAEELSPWLGELPGRTGRAEGAAVRTIYDTGGSDTVMLRAVRDGLKVRFVRLDCSREDEHCAKMLTDPDLFSYPPGSGGADIRQRLTYPALPHANGLIMGIEEEQRNTHIFKMNVRGPWGAGRWPMTQLTMYCAVDIGDGDDNDNGGGIQSILSETLDQRPAVTSARRGGVPVHMDLYGGERLVFMAVIGTNLCRTVFFGPHALLFHPETELTVIADGTRAIVSFLLAVHPGVVEEASNTEASNTEANARQHRAASPLIECLGAAVDAGYHIDMQPMMAERAPVQAVTHPMVACPSTLLLHSPSEFSAAHPCAFFTAASNFGSVNCLYARHVGRRITGLQIIYNIHQREILGSWSILTTGNNNYEGHYYHHAHNGGGGNDIREEFYIRRLRGEAAPLTHLTFCLAEVEACDATRPRGAAGKQKKCTYVTDIVPGQHPRSDRDLVFPIGALQGIAWWFTSTCDHIEPWEPTFRRPAYPDAVANGARVQEQSEAKLLTD